MTRLEASMPRAPASEPSIVPVGDSALLLTPGSTGFDAALQARLQALARMPENGAAPGTFSELVLGVNNLLGVFDPLTTSQEEARRALLELWHRVPPPPEAAAEIEIPVAYGGAAGEDLPQLAAAAGLSERDYVRRHSETVYTVACIGAYPGFAFMSGLPPELAAPRRAVPRLSLAKGSVIVGGVQAGVMSCTAPSGWHVLGTTDVDMFDPYRAVPCRVRPGDRVMFTVKAFPGA